MQSCTPDREDYYQQYEIDRTGDKANDPSTSIAEQVDPIVSANTETAAFTHDEDNNGDGDNVDDDDDNDDGSEDDDT